MTLFGVLNFPVYNTVDLFFNLMYDLESNNHILQKYGLYKRSWGWR